MGLRRGVLKRYSTTISALTQLMDVLLCVAAAFLTYALRFNSAVSALPSGYIELILIGSLLVLITFPMMGVYQSWRTRGWAAPACRALAAWVVVFFLIMVFLVATKQAEIFSRVWIASWLGWGALFVMAARIVVYFVLRMLRRRGFNRRYVVVIGDSVQAQELVQTAQQAVWTGFEIAAVFSDQQRMNISEGVPLQPMSVLTGYIGSHQVDEVWIALPLGKGEQLREVLSQLRYCTANIRYAPDFFGLFLLNRGATEVLGMPMIDLSASPMQGVSQILKALEDRLLVIFILVFISPLMLLIAVGVKLSSRGPVLFVQQRLGWDGREIRVYKFRSMRPHTEERGVVSQARAGDPRITRFGAFLRRTSLDELPQFINVLQGTMSIVGPRPHALEHNRQYKVLVDHYMLRHKVKPGITGWAQINGWRGETDSVDKMRHRVEYDLYYIENWSLWFDLRIIFLTLFKGFVNKNAY